MATAGTDRAGAAAWGVGVAARAAASRPRAAPAVPVPGVLWTTKGRRLRPSGSSVSGGLVRATRRALGGGFDVGGRVCCRVGCVGDCGHVRLLAVVLLLRQDAEGGGGSFRAGGALARGWVRVPVRGRPVRVRCRDPAGRARCRDPARPGLGCGFGFGDREGGGDRQGDHLVVRHDRARHGHDGRRRRRGPEDRGRDVRDRRVVQGDGRCLHRGCVGRLGILRWVGDPRTQPGEAAALVLLRLLVGLRLLAHRAQEDRLEADWRGSVQLRDLPVGTAEGRGWGHRAEPVAPVGGAGLTELGQCGRGGEPGPRGCGRTRTRRDRDAARRRRRTLFSRAIMVRQPTPEQVVGAHPRLHRVGAHLSKVRCATPVCSRN